MPRTLAEMTFVQVWFQNSRARQKKHQQTTTTVSLSHARNNNNNSSSRPTTPSSLMTRHPAAAVAVLSAAAAASYMNLNLRNSLVLHSSGAVGPSAFAADQPPSLGAVTADVQQRDEFVFGHVSPGALAHIAACFAFPTSECVLFYTSAVITTDLTTVAFLFKLNVTQKGAQDIVYIFISRNFYVYCFMVLCYGSLLIDCSEIVMMLVLANDDCCHSCAAAGLCLQ